MVMVQRQRSLLPRASSRTFRGWLTDPLHSRWTVMRSATCENPRSTQLNLRFSGGRKKRRQRIRDVSAERTVRQRTAVTECTHRAVRTQSSGQRNKIWSHTFRPRSPLPSAMLNYRSSIKSMINGDPLLCPLVLKRKLISWCRWKDNTTRWVKVYKNSIFLLSLK